MLQAVFGKFYKQIKKKKHSDGVIVTSFILLEFENLKFCKTEFKLSFFYVSNLLVAWIEFYGG